MLNHKWIFNLVLMITVIGLLAACGGGNDTPDQAQVNNETENDNTATEVEEATSTYPEENITIIVPYSAGGVSDLNARAFAENALKYTDKRIAVENVGGGSGTVGNYRVVQAKPDGYTWLWGASGHMSSILHIVDAPYTMDDFTIVNKVGHMSTVLVVPADSPFDTLDDFITYAKENPNALEIGNPGSGTVVALLARLLQRNAEIEVEHVPFDGSGPLLSAVIGGHVQSALMNMSEVSGQVKAGTLKALGVLSEERDNALPDVPTVIEQGIEGVAGGASHFIVIPNGVPEETIKAIDEFSRKVYETEEFKEFMATSGFQLEYKDGAAAREELEAWYDISEELYKMVEDTE